MMSSKSDPYLSREELELRRRILLKPDQFTDAQIAAAGLTDEVRGRQYDPKTYEMETSPVDPRTPKRKVDLRKVIPEVGD